MTEHTKTVCVGRFLIDVPAQAEVALSQETIDGFQVASLEEDAAAFRARVAAREAQLAALGPRPAAGEPGGSRGPGGLVEARDLRVDGMEGRIFIHGKDRTRGIEGGRRIDVEWVSVEAHAHTAGVSFSLSMQYASEADADTAQALLARLQVRGDDAVPNVPGFCTSRAVFAEPLPAHRNENVTLHVGLPGHPDLALVLFSVANANPGPGLLARAAEVDANAGADELLRVTKLRLDKRDINGMPGEEIAERVHELNFTTGYTLNWETRGVQGDVLQPYLSFEMQTGVAERPGGKPVDTSLHEDAVLALWDTISSTIRLRKSEPPPPAAAPEPEGPKLGTMARAGDTCPQSGWWECSAGGGELRVHGGQVQFVRKGERMPQPLLLPRQTLWQKVRGIQPSIEPDQPTLWQLVDKRSRPRLPDAAPLAPAGLGAAQLSVAAAGARPAAVGSYVRTGDACPASGWWRCEESHALDGTRWFAAGSLLPAATFRVPQGVFGRAAGPEVIQRRSMWQLVRHAPAPTGPAASAPADVLAGAPGAPAAATSVATSSAATPAAGAAVPDEPPAVA